MYVNHIPSIKKEYDHLNKPHLSLKGCCCCCCLKASGVGKSKQLNTLDLMSCLFELYLYVFIYWFLRHTLTLHLKLARIQCRTTFLTLPPKRLTTNVNHHNHLGLDLMFQNNWRKNITLNFNMQLFLLFYGSSSTNWRSPSKNIMSIKDTWLCILQKKPNYHLYQENSKFPCFMTI